MNDQGELPSVDDKALSAKEIFQWAHQQQDDTLEQAIPALFQGLLSLAAQPKYTSTSACVKLCGFVDQCSRSDRQSLQSWTFSLDTSSRLYHFYTEWNERDQNRSLRLVLDLLTHLVAHNPSQQVGCEIKQTLLDSLVSIVARNSSRPLAKSAFTALNHFMIKGLITLDDILSSYKDPSCEGQGSTDLELCESLTKDVLKWLSLHYVCSAAGKFQVTLFKSMRLAATHSDTQTNLAGFTSGTWLAWLQSILEPQPDLLESAKIYVLTPLFKADRDGGLEILRILNAPTPAQSNGLFAQADNVHDDVVNADLLRLAGLEAGKKEGLVEDLGHAGIMDSDNKVAMNESMLETFLSHRSHHLRSLALSLLVSSSSAVRPYSQSALVLLQNHMATFFAESDAKFRYEVLAHIKDMINRVKSAISNMQRIISQDPNKLLASGYSSQIKQIEKIFGKNENLLRDTLRYHEAFFAWFITFLRSELVPTVSYQRHIMALKVTGLLFRFRKDMSSQQERLDLETMSIVARDANWIRSILDLMLDPFDDVRDAAAAILMTLPQELVHAQVARAKNGKKQTTLLSAVQEFRGRSTSLSARTGRADHGDGAARAHGLVCSWLGSLEERVKFLSSVLENLELKQSRASANLGQAALENPVHADFAAIRYTWAVLLKEKYDPSDIGQFGPIQQRITDCCQRQWDLVKHVLCDDSPEGHLPEEMEEVEGLDTKDLLSYSFRSIHESSNAMRALVSILKFSRVAGTVHPPATAFQQIGNLTFEQLSTLRHRGAFTTVSQTFTTCCQVSQDSHSALSDDPATTELLQTWYEKTLQCIHEQASTTRRSAGIPSLMTGILAANATRPSFEEVIKKLQDIAWRPAWVLETDGSNLSQVHALNCLKDVFKSSMLSKRAAKYLPETLELATDSLKSEVWAVRNCGLLLLRSLIDNLFGTGESKAQMESGWDGKAIRISYTKHPTLPGILTNLLKSGSGESMQAGLQNTYTAESVFPALDIIRRAGPPESAREELYGYISGYLGSPLWHVREIAARTLCSFLIREDWVPRVEELLQESSQSSNKLHGTLLSIKFLIERLFEVKGPLLEDIDRLVVVLRMVPSKILERCEELEAAFVEILNVACETGQDRITQMPRKSPLEFSSALLRHRASLYTVYQALSAPSFGMSGDGGLEQLRAILAELMTQDADTACAVLTTVQRIQSRTDDWNSEGGLVQIFFDLSMLPSAPEPRAQALVLLSEVMDSLLSRGLLRAVPANEDLVELWDTLQSVPMNPTLSQAILQCSGPLMAALALRAIQEMRPASSHSAFSQGIMKSSLSLMQPSLAAWSVTISKAGDAEEPFDSRFAAVSSLKSFFRALRRQNCYSAEFLPALLALYDALNDDDEDVRDVAAEAAAPILGATLLPIEAANKLLHEMSDTKELYELSEFRTEAACRLSGNPNDIHAEGGRPVTPPAWEPAASQLLRAMEFDTSLFVIEEQNLFIDEVREAYRWASVFQRISEHELAIPAPAGIVQQLTTWTRGGLEALLLLARGEEKDGPLGWASSPDVFAICTRIVLCAVTLAKREARRGKVDELRSSFGEHRDSRGRLSDMVEEFDKVGREKGVHGSLMSMIRM